jgi:hypothetical protein
MLRMVVGDAEFLNAMRDWYANNDKGNARRTIPATQEMRYGPPSTYSSSSGIYGTGQPNYEYGWTTAARQRHVSQLCEGPANADHVRTVHDARRSDLYTSGGSEPAQGHERSARSVFRPGHDATRDFVEIDRQDWILKESRSLVPLSDATADGVPDGVDNCVGDANVLQDDSISTVPGTSAIPMTTNDGLAMSPIALPTMGPRVSRDSSTRWSSVASMRARGFVGRGARAESHDVQRGTLSALSVGDYGTCFASPVATTDIDDLEVPIADDGFFYLVGGYDAGCGGHGSIGRTASRAQAAACP